MELYKYLFYAYKTSYPHIHIANNRNNNLNINKLLLDGVLDHTL